MSQAFAYDRIFKGGFPQPTIFDATVNPSSVVWGKITGPASTVQAGMAITGLTTDLPSHCYGGCVVGVGTATSALYDLRIVPSATYTTSALTVEVIRRSTGTLLSSSVNLSSGPNVWYMMFWGY